MPGVQTNSEQIKNEKEPFLHQAWLHLRKAYNNWKSGGKMKDPLCGTFLKYKQAKRQFQCRYRQEAEWKHIRDNNLIMRADLNNKSQFFNIIKNIRTNKRSQAPTTLNTPAGTYHGVDTLEGFTVDAELLGQAVGESPEYDNEFYKLCVLDNSYIFEFKGEDAITIPDMKIELQIDCGTLTLFWHRCKAGHIETP